MLQCRSRRPQLRVIIIVNIILIKNVVMKTEGEMEVDGDAISFSHTSNFMLSAKA